MAKKKRHAAAEIVAKLLEAEALAAKGETQSQIAKALGISVMTLHRWRKLRVRGVPASRSEPAPYFDQTVAVSPVSNPDIQSRIAELELENNRLRKLVTDLLLEKVRLEDDQRPSVGRRQSQILK